ncbi:DUF222 domain-containing protein [Parenemella sanctibonifatiensis]|uniref:DUF222 domain-containing protein n=1 Tax=Parenemella sanctibonifatiensis TaxID=2016505 RepID=A0A255EDX1_9ACTN|nr:DUF222 domain-containing protein [Parenemella sanctibonifatiensis]OYN89729.1 hypothetical protein CGZ91_09395 [Parenemella sanctibonifatiensis]
MTDPHTAAALNVISEIRAARQEKLQAEAREFMKVAEFADLYDADWYAIEYPNGPGPVGERLVRPGGEGTPLVGEFCVLELGAALGMSGDEAHVELAHALALRHRFPKTWEVLGEGKLRVWQVRRLIGETRELSVELCTKIDAQVAEFGTSMGKQALKNMIEAIVLEHSPEAAQTAHEAQLAGRHVTIDHRGDGVVREIHASVDVTTAIRLDAQLNRLATIIGQSQLRNRQAEAAVGDVPATMDPREVRRALALGILATPARALHLLQESLIDALDDAELDLAPDQSHLEDGGGEAAAAQGPAVGCPMASSPAHTCGQVTVDPAKLLPKAKLVVHVTDASLKDGGVARVEGVGPVLTSWLTDLLSDSHVTVRPVLAPDQAWATEAYEIPEAMREWVTLRNPRSMFPFSNRNSGHLDIDHTQPWALPPLAILPDPDPPDGEPPDRHPPDGHPPEDLPPTRPGNLAPLARKEHRAKTHASWHVVQPSPGILLWTSPLGFQYLVTASHCWLIHDPHDTINEDAAAAAA